VTRRRPDQRRRISEIDPTALPLELVETPWNELGERHTPEVVTGSW